jgi:hypothetical protein
MTGLQNLSIGTKEGWTKIANAAPTPRPALLSARQLTKLSSAELTAYNRSRRVWHANMGVRNFSRWMSPVGVRRLWWRSPGWCSGLVG